MQSSNKEYSFTILLFLCFALSGATSLVLEVVWVRLLTQVFGSSNLAISTVLATFMAGLALGSWLGGRLVDRFKQDPLWLYAVCEVGVGITALVVPWAIATFPGVNPWLWGQLADWPVALSLVRALLCALLLLMPTTFMGATLPILSRAVMLHSPDIKNLGSKVAGLYAINTAGAVTGAFLAGFWFLPNMGLRAVHWMAVLVALGVGGLAAGLARWRNARDLGGVDAPPAQSESELQAEAPSPLRSKDEILDARLALAAFAISGAVAMALESIFSRAMALVLGSAIQSFTLVLVLFLIGLSLGAALMGRLASRTKEPLAWLGLTLACAALALVVVYSYIDALPHWHHALVRWADVDLDSRSGIAVRALIAGAIAPVTFFLGAVMPLAVAAYAKSKQTVGRDVGRAYSINTVGAVIGSIAGGFFLLPISGIGGGLTNCAVMLLGAAIVLSFRTKSAVVQWGTRGLAAFAYLLLFVVPPVDVREMNQGMFAYLSTESETWDSFQKENKLVYAQDGRASTITVFENQGTYALLNNGKPDGSSHDDVLTQILLGLLPAMLHPEETSDAFVIGYGTGMTVGSLTQAPNIENVEVVEIEEAVYEAADKFFGPYTHFPENNPNVSRFVGDGRNFLVSRESKYGIIVSEPPDIWVAGVASLFSHEFYQAVQNHLTPGGIFCQWVPLYHLRLSTIQMVYRTLHQTFPYVQVFVLPNNNSIVLATMEPLSISAPKLLERGMNKTAKLELARAGIPHPFTLLGLLALNPKELNEFTGRGEIHTYDNSNLEFAAQSDYLYSIRNRDDSEQLRAELYTAFAPFGSLLGMDIDLGTGEAAAQNKGAFSNVLRGARKFPLAKEWDEQKL